MQSLILCLLVTIFNCNHVVTQTVALSPGLTPISPVHHFKFNLTSAHCYDPEEDTAVDTTMKWNIKTFEDRYTSFCYDNDGMGYGYGSNAKSCCECLTYKCGFGTCPKHDGSPQNFLYWYLHEVSSRCCQDCKGAVFPPDHVMGVTTMKDKCKTKVTSECKHYDALSTDHGVVIKTYAPQDCCLDSNGLYSVNHSKLDPSSCSLKTCAKGRPSMWFETPVLPGECDCCVFNGTFIPEGGKVKVARDEWATCCDGKLVVDFNISVPIDCSDPTAVHSSIGFSIDNTGSVGSSEIGIIALSNALIDGIDVAGFTIPKWVLTTFNDVSEALADNTELVIETTDSLAMKTAVNGIVYGGGGDAAERALQGLLLTLQTLPKHCMVLVFTDCPSKNLDLEAQLMVLREDKMAKIFFVLAPSYCGTVGDPSWEVFTKLSEGKIYNMASFNKTEFIEAVVTIIGDDCVGSDGSDKISNKRPARMSGHFCYDPEQGCNESEQICQKCNKVCQKAEEICEKKPAGEKCKKKTESCDGMKEDCKTTSCANST